MAQAENRARGMAAALLTPVMMGMAPIFGKLALRSGVDPYTLTALRTCLAALALWVVFALFYRRYIYIFPAGLIGTIAVGAINGLGSLLYYNGLLLLDNASLAQLLNMLYVLFVMVLTRVYGHQVSKLSLLRVGLALVAVYLLVAYGQEYSRPPLHWAGVGLLIGAAFAYALHAYLSQRVMYEMPAPTMALYALTWMGTTVLLARLVYGALFPLRWEPAVPSGWWFVAGLTVVTALGRVTLFAGVRNLGSLQTLLLNVGELGVTLLAAFVWLGERMTPIQWAGMGVLVLSMMLSRWDGQVRDDVYRPLPHPVPFGGLPRDRGPLKPNAFSTVSRVYRRRPGAGPSGEK